LADRHGGALPVVLLVAGAAVMAGVLWWPAVLGVGSSGSDLAGVVRRVLTPRAVLVLHGVLALSLLGWFGFNAAAGGAGLARLLDVPAAPLIVLVAVLELLLVGGGIARWNGLAVLTGCTSMALVLLVGVQVGRVPVSAGGGLGAADLAVFVGYVAAFAVRSPDFTSGLRGRGDVAVSVALLLAATTGTAVVGAAVRAEAGVGDLVAAMADVSAAGGVFLPFATVAPALVSAHSGRRCVEVVSGRRDVLLAAAALAVAVALARPDRNLLPWLSCVGAALPPAMVPILVQRRRPGGLAPTWTWLPGAALGAALSWSSPGVAVVAGVALAGACTLVWRRRR
jgi:cytosine permease